MMEVYEHVHYPYDRRSRYSLCAIVAAASFGVVLGIAITLVIHYAAYASHTEADSFRGKPTDSTTDRNDKAIDSDFIRAENVSGSAQETIDNSSSFVFPSPPTDKPEADSFRGKPTNSTTDRNDKAIDCDLIRAENMSGSPQETMDNLRHCEKCHPRLHVVEITSASHDDKLDNGGYFRPQSMFVPRCPDTKCFDDKGKAYGICCPTKRACKTFQYYVVNELEIVIDRRNHSLEVHYCCACKCRKKSELEKLVCDDVDITQK